MTDEEMAEEYKEKHICSTCADIQDCGNDCPFSRCGVQAFLAGLKAGRPQWHDLREDPNDLPKTDKDVIAYRKDSGSDFDYYRGDFDYYRGGAWFGNANGYESEQPIAWCEIPTFNKEIE